MAIETQARPVWAARVAALDERARILNDSLPVDRRLWPEELALSRAYAMTLVECEVLGDRECQALLTACDALEADLISGGTTLAGEDVHGAVEAELIARCGDPARKLHTGRSRNDQVSTLMRMKVMALASETVEQLRDLEAALVQQARAAADLAVAGNTHLQAAQPVLLAHWWLAHVAAFERDEQRLAAARETADRMPLGAGAVAGTPLRYDRLALATRLGFSRLAANSIDAVGDRDFALDYLNAASTLAVHLSRLAEDLVLACSPGFGWFAAPQGFSTGSSLLPNKRNPDVFELVRGKAGRLMANASRLAIVMKGLPSSYQKDLQEDKEAVFDTADTLGTVLRALAPAVAALVPDRDRIEQGLSSDLLAVELADALVGEGVPFRDAHAQVGRLWAVAEQAGVSAAALPEAQRLAISTSFTDERFRALTVEAALARRSHAPGAGADSVARQLEHAEARLGISGAAAAEASRPAAAAPSARNGSATASQRSGLPSTPAVPRTPARGSGIVVRRALVADIPGIAGLMADFVSAGLLLPRPTGELYQAAREFHVAERDGELVGCAALRLMWSDLAEVRSLAVAPGHAGLGIGKALVQALLDDARALDLPRVIALTREVEFFERCGFTVLERDALPRKVWNDCVRCPRRHACDEVPVALDLVPGASERAARAGRSWTLPIPPQARPLGDPATKEVFPHGS